MQECRNAGMPDLRAEERLYASAEIPRRRAALPAFLRSCIPAFSVFPGLLRLWQEDADRRPVPWNRLYLNLAVVHLHGAIDHRESDAAAVFPGGEVEIEDPLQVLRLNADARVGKRNGGAAGARRLASIFQRAAIRHRLTRVEGEVEERLPEHHGIAVHSRSAIALHRHL